MKKNKLFVSLLAAGMLVISPAMADDVVKISTNKQAGETVTLQVNQLGSGATVDWGNGPVEITATDDDNLTLTGKLASSTITITTPSKLRTLICDGIGATAIDITGAPNLQSLYCQNNAITALDLSTCPALTDLNCENNQLSKIALSSSVNAKLQNLNLAGNQLSSSFSFSGANLQHLNVSRNKITSLSLNSNGNLDVLKCAENKLTSLTTASEELSVVMCGDNELTALNVNGYVTQLRQLFAENNKMTRLNVAKATKLKYLAVENNELSSISLSEDPSFYAFTCQNNKLTYQYLPTANEVTNIKYLPQDKDALKVDISSMLRSKRINGTRYYYLLTATNSDYRKLVLPYVLDLTAYRDGASFVFLNNAGEQVNEDDIIAKSSSTYAGYVAFKTPQSGIHVEMQPKYYPELAMTATPSFYVVKSDDDLASAVTGIGEVVNTNNDLNVKGANGVLTLSAATSTAVKVYGAAGNLVWQGIVEGVQQVNLTTGVYVVNGKKVIL